MFRNVDVTHPDPCLLSKKYQNYNLKEIWNFDFLLVQID